MSRPEIRVAFTSTHLPLLKRTSATPLLDTNIPSRHKPHPARPQSNAPPTTLRIAPSTFRTTNLEGNPVSNNKTTHQYSNRINAPTQHTNVRKKRKHTTKAETTPNGIVYVVTGVVVGHAAVNIAYVSLLIISPPAGSGSALGPTLDSDTDGKSCDWSISLYEAAWIAV